MNLKLIALCCLSLVAFAATKTAVLVKGRCSICTEESETSRVIIDRVSMFNSIPAVFIECANPDYYDEAGKYRPGCVPTEPPPQHIGKCTRGHDVFNK